MKTSPAYQAKRGKTVRSSVVEQRENGLDREIKAEASRTLVRVSLGSGDRLVAALFVRAERGEWRCVLDREMSYEEKRRGYKKFLSLMAHEARYGARAAQRASN